MSIYIPFNFRPVEIKSVGNIASAGLDSDASTYTPPANRYARVFAKGGIISIGTTFRDEAFGVMRNLADGVFPAPQGDNNYTYKNMGQGYYLITTNQLNGFPFDNFRYEFGTPPGQPVSTPGSPTGGFRQSPWFYNEGDTDLTITYRNPHGVQLNVVIQTYFIPMTTHDFFINETQTIRILGTRAQVTEYVNI